MQALRAVGSIDQSGILALPRLESFGWKPSIFPAGILAIRYTFEREDARIDVPAHLSVLRFRDC